MKTKRLLTMAAVLCCLTAMLPDAQAQNGEMRWFKRFCGREGNASWIPSNHIIDAKMDSAGNIFVFGLMGYGAHLDGRYICPADSLYGVNNESGYFLAKIDTAGNVPWIRTTKPGSIDAFLGMTVKNGRVYIAQNEEIHGFYSVWYWFIDTLYRKNIPSEGHINLDSLYDGFPFETPNSFYTRILVFDTAGNLLDHHRIDIANNDYNGVEFTNRLTSYRIGTGLIDVDSKGSLYIFTNISTTYEWKPWNQENPLVFRLFNKDTMLEFSTGLEERYTDHYDQINAATLIKIDPSWQHVEFIPLIDSVSGWSRRPLYDSVQFWPEEWMTRITGMPIEFLYNGLTIDKGDNIYLSGNMFANSQIREDLTGYGDSLTLLMDVTAPSKFFFDSVHYLIAEDLGLLASLPFVLKMDTAGHVLWANQMYTDQDVMDLYISQSTMQNHTLDSDYLYVRLVPQSYNFIRERIHFFTDADHRDTIKLPPDNIHLLYLMYDKTTGECVAHHLLDTNLWSDQTKRNPVNVTGNKVTMAMNRLKGENTFRDLMMEIQHDRGTGEITKSPSTELEKYNLVNMLQHPHGFKFWYGRQGSSAGDMRIRGGDTVVYLQKNECFMMLYYDSTADCRRHHDTASIDTSGIDTTGIDTTGIARVANAAPLFTLTPNPTTGEVTVTLGILNSQLSILNSPMTLTLRDAAGHEVFRKELSTLMNVSPDTGCQFSIPLDLRHLPSGAYFVTLATTTASSTQRLVVK